MKVLLSPIGSRGDVQPLLVLARALSGRGHEVTFAAPPNFCEWLEHAGFRALPIGSDTHRLILENQRLAEQNPLAALPEQFRLLARETEQQMDDLLRAAPAADLVVGAGLSFAARSLADLLRVPYCFVCYTLAGIRSRAHAPAAAPVAGLPSAGNAALWWTLVTSFDRFLGPAVNRSRRKRGLPEHESPWRAIHASGTLLAQDALLGELPADARRRTEHVPALVEVGALEPLPGDVEEWLAAQRRERRGVAYVGFGSMPTVDRARVLAALGELSAARGTSVLVFSAHEEDRELALPPGVRAIGASAHRALFPRVDLVVHHGGAGTTATALRAGVPQFVVPHIVDQYFHGRRVAELGLAAAPVPKAKLTARALVAAWDRTRSLTTRAAEIGAAWRGVSGAEPASSHLEALAAGRGRLAPTL